MQAEFDDDHIDYEKYFKNNNIKNVISLLLKDIILQCLVSYPELYVKITKFFYSIEQSPKNEIIEKLLQNFISNLQASLSKDIYYRKLNNKTTEHSNESPEELMTNFLKSIDEKEVKITEFWSFLYFLHNIDNPSSAIYLDEFFTREYQVADIILWIHSCYTFNILNRIIM